MEGAENLISCLSSLLIYKRVTLFTSAEKQTKILDEYRELHIKSPRHNIFSCFSNFLGFYAFGNKPTLIILEPLGANSYSRRGPGQHVANFSQFRTTSTVHRDLPFRSSGAAPLHSPARNNFPHFAHSSRAQVPERVASLIPGSRSRAAASRPMHQDGSALVTAPLSIGGARAGARARRAVLEATRPIVCHRGRGCGRLLRKASASRSSPSLHY